MVAEEFEQWEVRLHVLVVCWGRDGYLEFESGMTEVDGEQK